MHRTHHHHHGHAAQLTTVIEPPLSFRQKLRQQGHELMNQIYRHLSSPVLHRPHRNPAQPSRPVIMAPTILAPGAPRGNAPLEPGNLAGALQLSRKLHYRYGEELQTVRIGPNGTAVGVVTEYPRTPQAVANMLKKAKLSPHPRVVNLMDPGDMGIRTSYVDDLPEGVPTQVGDVWVKKISGIRESMGPNSARYGATQIEHETATLLVFDPNKPSEGWSPVEYHAFKNWRDTTSLPPQTFERVWRSLYVPGRTYMDVIHCAGGVGRTGTVLLRLLGQVFLDQRSAAGNPATPQDIANFVRDMTILLRQLRGPQFLPDDGQIKMVHESMLASMDVPVPGHEWPQPMPFMPVPPMHHGPIPVSVMG